MKTNTEAGKNLLEETTHLLKQSKNNLNQPLNYSNVFSLATLVLDEKLNNKSVITPNNNSEGNPIPEFLKFWNLNTPNFNYSNNNFDNWSNVMPSEIMGYLDESSSDESDSLS